MGTDVSLQGTDVSLVSWQAANYTLPTQLFVPCNQYSQVNTLLFNYALNSPPTVQWSQYSINTTSHNLLSIDLSAPLDY